MVSAMSDYNPYELELRPACISFSGGRSSGYMLYHILKAHNFSLPDDIQVIFANTGKERPETLEFVHRCEVEWKVNIVWVEWDPVARFCTKTLKVWPIEAYCRHELGWKKWSKVLGFRGDETRRVIRADDCKEVGTKATTGLQAMYPMWESKVSKEDVLAFWREQPFDLGIEDWQGNCDACFLKSRKKIMRIARLDPKVLDWWIKMENLKACKKPSGYVFRKDWPGGYEGIRREAAQSPEFDMFDDFDDQSDIECHCHD